MQIKYYREPDLEFGFNQKAKDPRDGLTLFGPYEPLAPFKMRVGIVSTAHGYNAYRSFVHRLKSPIFSSKRVYGKLVDDEPSRPSFPGFETVFGVQWEETPDIYKELQETRIETILKEPNRRKRAQILTDLYLNEIIKAVKTEDQRCDIWFIVVPRKVYFSCRPKSWGKDLSTSAKTFIKSSKKGQGILDFPGFENFLEEVERSSDNSSDFHHLLKAKLILAGVESPIQIILEPTLLFRDKYRNHPYEENMKAHLAWTQSTTVYYKLGKLPWKLSDIREGVCYLGLVFKKLNLLTTEGSVCSAAQMFLKDGDGSIFRGNIGLWESANSKEYHLDSSTAEELLLMAMDDYYDKKGTYPQELFIHGRANFSVEEWQGFNKAKESRNQDTNLVGIVIKEAPSLKIYREIQGEKCNYGVLRGIALQVSEREAYLFSRGFVPRIQTSMSLEMPNPLHIRIARGESNIDTVVSDVLALTKLNYNACQYGDGLPVTLRFSDVIGGILTSTENWIVEQRQFRYYI